LTVCFPQPILKFPIASIKIKDYTITPRKLPNEVHENEK
jgi:hypothetical protein